MIPRRKPMSRTTPLERGTPLRRGTSGLAASGRRSNGMAGKLQRGPVKPRNESTHIPNPIRLAVYARDEWCCQRCGVYIPDSGLRWGLQHRRPRQAGGSKLLHTMSNLVLLCGWTVDPGTCTEWVELGDRPEATRLGWLVPPGAAPEEWPVLRLGLAWEQPGDAWLPADPNPRQLEAVA